MHFRCKLIRCFHRICNFHPHQDYFVPIDTAGQSEWLFNVLAANVISGFVFDFVDKNSKLLNTYSSPKDFANEFTVSEELFKSFIKKAEENGVESIAEDILHSKNWILKRLKTSIARQKWNDLGFFTVFNYDDKCVSKALELLKK